MTRPNFRAIYYLLKCPWERFNKRVPKGVTPNCMQVLTWILYRSAHILTRAKLWPVSVRRKVLQTQLLEISECSLISEQYHTF